MKTMTISAFKAHMSAELRKVRKGARLIILDRETPIAQVVPYSTGQAPALGVRPPSILPFTASRPSFRISHDPLEYLVEDRGRR